MKHKKLFLSLSLVACLGLGFIHLSNHADMQDNTSTVKSQINYSNGYTTEQYCRLNSISYELVEAMYDFDSSVSEQTYAERLLEHFNFGTAIDEAVMDCCSCNRDIAEEILYYASEKEEY